MKYTPTNKDHIARLIAEKAFKLPADEDDAYNNMLRVSEALQSIGEIGSKFKSLEDFRTHNLPTGEDTDSNVSFFEALADALMVVADTA